MKTTTYYDLNIVEGTDIVNPLTVDNPNYQKIDETMHDNAVAGVTLATELTNATIHALTRENSDCSVIRFIATSRWKAGDSVTVDGVPVLALLPSGETLPDGAYVINANVFCVLTGTNLTVYVGKSATDANEIAFNDTTVGAELVRLNGEIVNLDGEVTSLNGEIVRLDGEIDNVNSKLSDLSKYVLLASSTSPGQTITVEDISKFKEISVWLYMENDVGNVVTVPVEIFKTTSSSKRIISSFYDSALRRAICYYNSDTSITLSSDGSNYKAEVYGVK